MSANSVLYGNYGSEHIASSHEHPQGGSLDGKEVAQADHQTHFRTPSASQVSLGGFFL